MFSGKAGGIAMPLPVTVGASIASKDMFVDVNIIKLHGLAALRTADVKRQIIPHSMRISGVQPVMTVLFFGQIKSCLIPKNLLAGSDKHGMFPQTGGIHIY